MIWIAGALGYIFAVWLFLRFFNFVSDVDSDAERLSQRKENRA